LRARIARQIAANIKNPGDQATSVPGLILYRKVKPIECGSGQYEPSLNIFVQGRKRINVAGLPYLCDESSFLLTSVDLPVTSQILEASVEKPLLAMLLKFDMIVVREVVALEEEPDREESSEVGGMVMGTTTVDLLNPCLRLLELLETPADIPFMSNLLQREIVYRLLRGPQGARLRAIATNGDQSHRTAKAVAWLRANYAQPSQICWPVAASNRDHLVDWRFHFGRMIGTSRSTTNGIHQDPHQEVRKSTLHPKQISNRASVSPRKGDFSSHWQRIALQYAP
jgi:AraC-type transcriptional regulator N-terminus